MERAAEGSGAAGAEGLLPRDRCAGRSRPTAERRQRSIPGGERCARCQRRGYGGREGGSSMPEAEPKQRHPYRSVRFPKGRRGLPVEGRHVIAALGTLAAGVIACAAGLWPIAVVLFFGAFTTWLFWAVPYAVYLACGGRWSWLSTHRHVAALLVWMLRPRGGSRRLHLGRRSPRASRAARPRHPRPHDRPGDAQVPHRSRALPRDAARVRAAQPRARPGSPA